MTRATIPRRVSGPPRSSFEPLAFHGWYGCKGCGDVVYDWARHADVCHEHPDDSHAETDLEPITPANLAERANAEGRAVVEFAAAHPWREAWRQVAACLRITPPKNARPAAVVDPPTVPPAAGRAQQWAAMADLIERTTEA